MVHEPCQTLVEYAAARQNSLVIHASHAYTQQGYASASDHHQAAEFRLAAVRGRC